MYSISLEETQSPFSGSARLEMEHAMQIQQLTTIRILKKNKTDYEIKIN